MKFNVIVRVPDGYAILTHKGRSEWSRRVAMKHAKEYKAEYLRDAWVCPADEPFGEESL